MMFQDEAINPVSTVHLQTAAMAEGQRMFTITKDNVEEALPQIAGLPQNTKADLQNAVFFGREVTIHEAPIERGSWRGFGYTILDPNTGAGVYMIDGGVAGGCATCNANNIDFSNCTNSTAYAGSFWAFVAGVVLSILFIFFDYLEAIMIDTGGAATFMGVVVALFTAITIMYDDNLNCEQKSQMLSILLIIFILAVIIPILSFASIAVIAIVYSIVLTLMEESPDYEAKCDEK